MWRHGRTAPGSSSHHTRGGGPGLFPRWRSRSSPTGNGAASFLPPRASRMSAYRRRPTRQTVSPSPPPPVFLPMTAVGTSSRSTSNRQAIAQPCSSSPAGLGMQKSASPVTMNCRSKSATATAGAMLFPSTPWGGSCGRTNPWRGSIEQEPVSHLQKASKVGLPTSGSCKAVSRSAAPLPVVDKALSFPIRALFSSA